MNSKLTRYIGSLSRRTLSFLARRDLDEEGGGADLGRMRGWEKAFERRVLMGSLGVLKSGASEVENGWKVDEGITADERLEAEPDWDLERQSEGE